MSNVDEITVAKAIKSLNSEAQFRVCENNSNIVDWFDDTPPILPADIDAEIVRLQAEEDAQEYARNRAAEYPSNGDQWDMIYKDNKNGTTTHAAAVETVKTKWPKDNSGPVE